jgi:glycosyltransferase involved in cell wall biosynthesis
VIEQPKNAGAYPARNRGLKEATGDLITTHDADDWSHPQKLEQQILLLREHPNAQGVILNWVRATDELHFTINWRPSDRIVHYSHSSFMLRRSAVEKIGQWDEVRIGADTEYIWRTQHHFGKEAIVHGESGVPFAFALDDAGSLTRTKATHVSTVYYGLRQIYREICRWYHRQQLDPTEKTRIPRAMTSKDTQQRTFDQLVVADFTRKRSADALLQDLKTELNDISLALLHWPLFSKRGKRFCDSYFELLHNDLAEPVVFGESLSVNKVYVANAELLLSMVVATPEFDSVKQVVLMHPQPDELTQAEQRQIEQQAKQLFTCDIIEWVTTDL